MQTPIYATGLVYTLIVCCVGIVIPRLCFNQRPLVGSIAVNFVGAHMNEHSAGTKLPRHFQKVEGAHGVYIKINERNLSSLVVRWLSGAVNDAIELRLPEQGGHCFPVPDVQILVREVACAALDASEIPTGIASGPEELLPQVV